MQPVPMSFPAFLRDSGIGDRFAHLRAGNSNNGSGLATGVSGGIAVPKKSKRDEKDGKRWVRRKENGSFSILLFLSITRTLRYSSSSYSLIFILLSFSLSIALALCNKSISPILIIISSSSSSFFSPFRRKPTHRHRFTEGLLHPPSHP